MLKKNVIVGKLSIGDRVEVNGGTGTVTSTPREEGEVTVVVVESGGKALSHTFRSDEMIPVYVLAADDSWEDIPVDYAAGEETTVVES